MRVSGKEALEIAGAIFVFASKKDAREASNWRPLFLNFGTFSGDGFSDKGYAVYFPSQKAFTGEDTVEFYLHGGVRILRGAVEEIIKRGAVAAERGEFTKRAFLAGKLSLSDAEGVIDMINAESAAAIRAAYRLMNGGLSSQIQKLSELLLDNIVSLEASLDYPDEMEDEVIAPLEIGLKRSREEISELIKSARAGKMAKFGITAVLTGKTNAGKSSLLNAFLKEERAIVTPIAGTTRDTVTESVECGGVKINLVDTAGMRESGDEIENAGIARAKAAVLSADVVLQVIDAAEALKALPHGQSCFTEAEAIALDKQKEICQKKNDCQDKSAARELVVFNKCDVLTETERGELEKSLCPPAYKAGESERMFMVSAKTGEGVDELLESIARLFVSGETEGGEIVTSERHLSALREAGLALDGAWESMKSGMSADCILIDLRAAYNALGKITGKTATEDIVNGIFSKFCVGK